MKSLVKFSLLALAAIFLMVGCQKEIEKNATQKTSQPGNTTNAVINPLCYNPNNVDPLKPCTREINPVCACGVVTFQNKCIAESMGFTNTTQGACNVTANCVNPVVASAFENTDCLAVYQPVCGCDGKTYSNYCTALASGVTLFTPGVCSGLPIAP